MTTAIALEDAAAVLPARITNRIEIDMFSGCWRWQGAKDRDGYPLVKADGKSWKTHRYVWTVLVGPIVGKLVLDHVKARGCAHRDCVNPAHLEPVTITTNSKRVEPWNRAKTHCPAGHDYAETGAYYECKDGYTRRFCNECSRDRHAPHSLRVRK